jgi:hypothetical protein
MTANERSIPTNSKSVICDSVQSLSIRYAELLRLRQAVRLAESQTRGTNSETSDLKRKLTVSSGRKRGGEASTKARTLVR